MTLYLDEDDTTADTNTGYEVRRNLTEDLKNINVIIPLNHTVSSKSSFNGRINRFFEELEGRMLVPMQLQFNIQLQNDAELIFKANAAAAGRVVIKGPFSS